MTGQARTAAQAWRTPGDSPCELLLIDEPTRPVLTLAVILPSGCLADPPGKEGLSYLVGQMLGRGAGAKNHAAIADEVDFLGASLSTTVGRHTTTISGDVLSRNLEPFEQLVAAMVREPVFDAEELAKLKRRTLAEIAQVVDSDAAVGQRHYIRSMFKGHPYGRPLKGTPQSVASITRDDVVGFFKSHVQRSGGFIASAGDITEERLSQLARTTVGGLPTNTVSTPVVPPAPVRDRVSAILVDKPERSQTQVFIGHTSTIHSTHPDYMALHLAQTYFGGTFTSRLTQEIREKRGWSYSVYSGLSSDRHLGTFTMRFMPAVKDTMPAIKLAHDLLAELQREGPSDDDVAFAKRYLTNSHPFSMDTSGRQLHERLMARLQGRPDSFVDEYVELIAAVTPEQVRDAVGEHIHPDRVTVGIVCTADDLEDDVKGWDRLKGDDAVRRVDASKYEG